MQVEGDAAAREASAHRVAHPRHDGVNAHRLPLARRPCVLEKTFDRCDHAVDLFLDNPQTPPDGGIGDLVLKELDVSRYEIERRSDLMRHVRHRLPHCCQLLGPRRCLPQA